MIELPEDAKSKAAFRFKAHLRTILQVFNIYGLGIFIDMVVELVMELAVQYAKVMRGIDVQIDHELAQKKLRSRSKK